MRDKFQNKCYQMISNSESDGNILQCPILSECQSMRIILHILFKKTQQILQRYRLPTDNFYKLHNIVNFFQTIYAL